LHLELFTVPSTSVTFYEVVKFGALRKPYNHLGAMEVPMSYKLAITQKPTYLHAIVTGLNNRENVTRYLEEILSECIARKCSRVLIEERLEGPRLGVFDVFEIASSGSRRTFGILKSIAYVDVNAEGDLMHFAETVAVNRALPVTVFPTVADAEKWLLEEDRKGTQHAPAEANEPRS
jgi:hypothetical protein